jgi:aspartyl-tRNA(Asn)/glutamyl-tRNA(Gln) amidotransferase subunit C
MFTHKDIQHIAKLARLSISSEEQSSFEVQLSSILDYVKKLEELKTQGVPEFVHASVGNNIFREDEIKLCEEETQDHLIAAFPQHQGRLLQVQAVFKNTSE